MAILDMWTPISKPTGTQYTNVNPDGRTQYDQADVLYDDADIFYDGINQAAWTDISKPVSSTWTLVSKAT